MTVYFTRHGETEWNTHDYICGRTDLPLTDKGLRQAEELAAKLPSDIGHILVSPLIRAQQTAAPCAERLGLVPVTDERLREWDYGDYEGRHRSTEGYMEAKLEFGVRMPRGESVFDIVSRVYPLLDELPQRYDKNVLIVSHGGICRIIEAYARGMTREQFAGFYMGNCELRSFDTDRVSKII